MSIATILYGEFTKKLNSWYEYGSIFDFFLTDTINRRGDAAVAAATAVAAAAAATIAAACCRVPACRFFNTIRYCCSGA